MANQNTMTALEAHTLVLLNHADKWSRAVRNDGFAFVLFAGSTGQTYWTTERSCSCRSAFFRGICAHMQAVATEAARARRAAVATKIEDLWPDDMESSF